jgi:hypothetical protein
MSVTKFWIELKDEYYLLFEKAMKILLPFSSTYLCEAEFSGMIHIKTETRNRLDTTLSLRVALTNTVEPRFDKIVKTFFNFKFLLILYLFLFFVIDISVLIYFIYIYICSYL